MTVKSTQCARNFGSFKQFLGYAYGAAGYEIKAKLHK